MISRLSGGVAYEGMLIYSFRPSNSLDGEGILSLMGVARIDSIAKYGSIPFFHDDVCVVANAQDSERAG